MLRCRFIHADQWVRLAAWDFLLVFSSNHSPTVHRCSAMDMGERDIFVFGFLDFDEGSSPFFKVCFFRLPEFLTALITVLHKTDFLEQAPGNAPDC